MNSFRIRAFLWDSQQCSSHIWVLFGDKRALRGSLELLLGGTETPILNTRGRTTHTTDHWIYFDLNVMVKEELVLCSPDHLGRNTTPL